MILSRGAALGEAPDNNFLRGNSFSPLQPEHGEFSVQNHYGVACEFLQFSVTFRANGEKKLLPPPSENNGMGFVSS